MRNNLTKLALAVFITALFHIMSCDDPNPSKLAKHWVLENDGSSMELLKDGKGSIGDIKILWKAEDKQLFITFVEKPDSTHAIDYQLSGSKLTFNGLVFIEKTEYDAKPKKEEVVATAKPVATEEPVASTFTDPRDKKTYKTIKIGSQIWMAQNLDYAGEDGNTGICHGGDPENCKKYGALYTWDEAKKLCPPGWHLPEHNEWQTLINFVGGEEIAGKKLKAKNSWEEDNCKYEETNGRGNVVVIDKCASDEFGFAALPGGTYETYDFKTSNVAFPAGTIGCWWSSSQASSDSYLARCIYNKNETKMGWSNNIHLHLTSVRCIKN